MKFSVVKDGQLGRLTLTDPQSFENTVFGYNATLDTYRSVGLWPIEKNDPGPKDYETRDKKYLTANSQSQTVVETQTYKLKDVQTYVEERKAKINTLRDSKIFAGAVDWTRPSDNTVVPVDMRSQADRANLQDLRSSAIELDSNGVTSPVIDFRGADNVTYSLTPQDMIEMTQSMLQRGQSFYVTAWNHKDQLQSLADDPNNTIQDVADYDITSGWPS